MVGVLVEIAEGAPVTEPQPIRAAYYHQKANEIRRFARQSKFPEIAEDLLKLAGQFERMAELVERRQLSDTTGRTHQCVMVPLPRSFAG